MTAWWDKPENSIEARFWRNAVRDPDTGCVEWVGTRTRLGYGSISYKGTVKSAHRVAWVLRHGGEIADIPHLDHVCDNRSCVNTDHLQPTTHRDNVLRGTGPTARNARKTHCLRGHPLTGENVYVIPSTGSRVCNTCQRARERARVGTR